MTERDTHLFSVQLRKATKNIHDVSDALVNAKLGVTINDDSVWAEGLLVFYEVFKFLEDALRSHSDSLIGDLLIEHMERTEAFQADLAFFYGGNWTENYTVRPEVQNYLDHLRELEEENPYLLIPYIYHLYMGLFSGGQILQAKRKYLSLTANTGQPRSGEAVTTYSQETIAGLKRKLRQAVNDLADSLDEETKEAILTESVKVFELNNTVIKSVKGINQVLLRRLFKFFIAAMLLLLFFFAYFFKTASELEVEGDIFGHQMKINNEEL